MSENCVIFHRIDTFSFSCLHFYTSHIFAHNISYNITQLISVFTTYITFELLQSLLAAVWRQLPSGLTEQKSVEFSFFFSFFCAIQHNFQ